MGKSLPFAEMPPTRVSFINSGLWCLVLQPKLGGETSKTLACGVMGPLFITNWFFWTKSWKESFCWWLNWFEKYDRQVGIISPGKKGYLKIRIDGRNPASFPTSDVRNPINDGIFTISTGAKHLRILHQRPEKSGSKGSESEIAANGGGGCIIWVVPLPSSGKPRFIGIPLLKIPSKDS